MLGHSPVLRTITEVAESEAAKYLRQHQHNIDSMQAIDDLRDAFERLVRVARAEALKDAASWCEHVGRSRSVGASVAYECVNVIRARANDEPEP